MVADGQKVLKSLGRDAGDQGMPDKAGNQIFVEGHLLIGVIPYIEPVFLPVPGGKNMVQQNARKSGKHNEPIVISGFQGLEHEPPPAQEGLQADQFAGGVRTSKYQMVFTGLHSTAAPVPKDNIVVNAHALHAVFIILHVRNVEVFIVSNDQIFQR